MGRIVVLVALASMLAGCGATSKELRPGRPTYDASGLPAYWIWNDDSGWHLRTTTSGELQHFRGVIEPVDGQFTGATPTRPDLGVQGGPERIVFDFQTKAFDEGLDWSVSSGCNRFTLNVNGEAKENRIFLGPKGNPPSFIPFVRCAAQR